jgi:hypothetical protein
VKVLKSFLAVALIAISRLVKPSLSGRYALIGDMDIKRLPVGFLIFVIPFWLAVRKLQEDWFQQ